MSQRIEKCSTCKAMNELDELESRPVDNVHYSFGYYCSECGAWEHLYFMSNILIQKEKALNKLKIGTPKYQKAFFKFKQKFDKLQERLNYATWRKNSFMKE